MDSPKDAETEVRSKEKSGLISNIDNSDNLSNAASNGTKPLEWSPENEMIIVEWCDAAQCYKWLHARSHEKYSSKNAWYTIPAIVLSTISGTASFAQASLPLDYQVYAPMVIGAINISVGILTTIQQYLKIAELNEAHRVSAISWDKFARNIRIELAKKPDERMDAEHFLKLNRQEFDRLMETSPMIKPDVVIEFERKFKGKEGTIERKHFDELKKPDICSVIISANETRHHWYLELDKPIENFSSADEELRSKNELIKTQQQKIKEKDEELKKKAQKELEKEKQQKEEEAVTESKKREHDKMFETESKKIDKYISTFVEMYSRKPHYDEIYENMKTEIDMDMLTRYLKTYSAK